MSFEEDRNRKRRIRKHKKMRGRKPKPTELKKSQGAKPCRINFKEPDFSMDDSANAPVYFDGYSKALWNVLYHELHKKKVLKITDRGTLETCCVSYGMYRQAFEDVKSKGTTILTKNGFFQENPCVNTMHKFMVLFNKTAAELGLTPSSRSRLIADTEKPGSKVRDFMMGGIKQNDHQGS
jgi:P27 family predicted phage terminase small subunit